LGKAAGIAGAVAKWEKFRFNPLLPGNKSLTIFSYHSNQNIGFNS
jgi:hypothetical protein